MKPGRRHGVGGWVSRLSTGKQALLFVAAAGSVGWAGLVAFTGFERKTGIMAEQFGFARAVDVRDVGDDVKSWQLFSDIRRVRRIIDDAGIPTSSEAKERLRDYTDQLTAMQTEFDRIEARKKQR